MLPDGAAPADGSHGPVVVTVVHGRLDHLRVQRAHLVRCEPPPTRHVVVAVDDAAVAGIIDEQPQLPTVLVLVAANAAGLPVAAARNAGARTALALGTGVIVFLDVDCIPHRHLLAGYAAALRQRPDAVVCGPVTYLPSPPSGGWSPAALAACRAPHPARPDPAVDEFVAVGPALFWSLSFAVSAATWARLGGFHEGYVGYGGEDTDLGFCAAAAGIDILSTGGADAFHQRHPVSDPPTEHLDDIVRNARIFQRRHGVLPMTGWLAAFRERGLIEQVGGLPRRSDPIRLLTVPARHEYLDAALPGTVERVATGRVTAWEPDPLLSADAFDAVAPGIDVVHVHFGYEHLAPEALRGWLDVLERRRIPLIVTVHDLRNPHLTDPARHEEQLRLLVARAAHVITLTDSVAQCCAELFGREFDVLAHPTLLDCSVTTEQRPRDAVLVPLKALRANVVDAPRIVGYAADAATAAGCRTTVWLDPAARDHPDFDAVTGLGQRPDVDVQLAGHMPHEHVVAAVAEAHAVLLPYRFGTHSGWIELARDVGTAVIAPDGGAYRDQWERVRTYRNDERTGLDPGTLASAVTTVCRADPPPPADRGARLVQRDLVRAAHEAIYRSVLTR